MVALFQRFSVSHREPKNGQKTEQKDVMEN